MKRQRDWPLRVHLAVFGLILLLPAVILGAAGISYYSETERERLARTAADLAGEVSRKIDGELGNLVVVLKTLATSPLLDDGAYREFHARSRLATAGTETYILLVDRSLRQLLNTRVAYGTPLPPTADPDTARAVFEKSRPHISNLFEGAVAGEPVFNVEVPVVRAGEVRYVLIGTRSAESLLAKVLPPLTGPGWIIGVSDRNNVIMARSQEADRFVGQRVSADTRRYSAGPQGVRRGINLDGKDVLRAYRRSPLSGWVTAAFIPVSVLEAPLQKTWTSFVLAAGGLILLTILLAAVAARRVALPIDVLGRGARALVRGEVVPEQTSRLREANEVSRELSKASSELKRREERLNLLMRELAHRTKNILTLTLAIAHQSKRRSSGFDDFHQRFTRRLSALSAALDLLVGSDWRGADLEELVHAELAPFADGAAPQLEIGGPSVRLNAQAAQHIGMALHELATNATKYGALSVPGGRVLINWQLAGGGETYLRFSWREAGGPPVVPPMETGFGRTVIEQVVARDLGAKVVMAFAPEGFWWEIDLPAGNFAQEAES